MKKKVLIFGASGYGQRVAYHISDECEIVAFVDRNPLFEGRSWGGYKVIYPQEIKNYNYDFIIISVGALEEKMRNELLKLKVPSEKITVFCPDREFTWLDERVVMAKCCIRYIKERDIKGNLAEVGVYRGAFSSLLSKYLSDRKIYLFDTFEGFAKNDLDTEKILEEHVFKDTSVQEVLEVMPNKNNVIIKKGYFPETAKDVEDTFCFVSLDADLYNPILAGLEFFYPRLEHGGYIFIHDFESIRYPGCKKAVLEFCEKYGINFMPILDRSSSAVITK